MSLATVLGSTLLLGPFAEPTVLIGTLIVPLLILVTGRALLGLAWRLVLIAVAGVIEVWLLRVLGTALNLI